MEDLRQVEPRTFPEMIAYFQGEKIEALGIGSLTGGFKQKLSNLRAYHKTPKPGWAGSRFCGAE